DPVELPAAAGNYWVYVEADIDQTIVNNMLPLEITAARIKVSALNTKPTQAPPNPSTGNPPEEGIYLLAQVTVGSAAITAINNTGSGSIGAYVYTQDLFFRAPVPATEHT